MSGASGGSHVVSAGDRTVPNPNRRKDRTTEKALFRRERFEMAVRGTPPRATKGWFDERPLLVSPNEAPRRTYQPSPDDELAYLIGQPYRQVYRRPTKHRSGYWESRFTIPPMFATRRGPLFSAAQCVLECTFGKYAQWHSATEPDPAVETVLSDGRTIFLFSYLYRLMQRMWLLTVTARADAIMHPLSHAYRPGRSHLTALDQARRLVARYPFAMVKDIEKFFENTLLRFVEIALREMCPWMSPGLRHLGLWFFRCAVLRRPWHPMRRAGRAEPWSPPKETLLTGSVTAPILANLVADYYLARPFEAAMNGEAVLIRVADDMLIMATSPTVAMRAVGVIDSLLRVPNLKLHPTKGTGEPVDVRHQPLEWLGKRLHGSRVRTPERVVREQADDLLAMDTGSPEFRRAAHAAKAELRLDPADRLEYLTRTLRRASRAHAAAFSQAGSGILRAPRAEDLYDFADASDAALAAVGAVR